MVFGWLEVVLQVVCLQDGFFCSLLCDGGIVLQKSAFLKKLAWRLAGFFGSLLLLSVAAFYFARLAPGDPLESFYGDAVEWMNAQELAAARARLGLDDSLFVQYIRWITGLLHGELGLSLRYKSPVWGVVSPLIGNTLLLGGTAYLLMFALAILLAMLCAFYEDTWIDRTICRIGTALYCLPSFWLGVLLVLLLGVNLRLLPSSGAYDIGKSGDLLNRLQHLILPLTTMVASHLWYYAYMIRNRLLDEVRKDYVLLAKAKGLSRSRILWAHCLRNAAPTIVNMMAISIPHVLSGTYVVESVFHYPGLGSLSVESAKYHDYNLLMLLVLMTGVLVILSSMAAQALNALLDPRINETEGSVWQK